METLAPKQELKSLTIPLEELDPSKGEHVIVYTIEDFTPTPDAGRVGPNGDGRDDQFYTSPVREE